MNPVQAVNSVFANSFNFSGRAMRSEYWWFVVFYASVSVILGLSVPWAGDGAYGALGIFLLAILVPYLAVGTRRLHDRNHTGWWQLISFVPFGGFLLLFWFAMPGDAGENRFGPPPVA